MKGRWGQCLSTGVVIAMLLGCSPKPTDRGQQYKDGHLTQSLALVEKLNLQGTPVNSQDYTAQLKEIKTVSPSLFGNHSSTYQAVQRWLAAGGDPHQLSQFGLSSYQMEGVDNYGNVQFTGYYTPVLQARKTKQGKFRYPLYGMPTKAKTLPHRADIYSGKLSKRHIIAYSDSLMDNFIMEVQGSGYVNFGNEHPLVLFGYAGKNGHPYRSIGKILIERGEVAPADMSLQAIRQWAAERSEDEVRELLVQNPSFVFFRPQGFAPVKGASAVPLIAKAAVASDTSLIPPGTTLLAEVPLLNDQGKFTGKYEMRLMVALDVGGAIKGQHFDIYQGIGPKAGHAAGYYNHYGRVWVLTDGNNGAPSFNTYQPMSALTGVQ